MLETIAAVLVFVSVFIALYFRAASNEIKMSDEYKLETKKSSIGIKTAEVLGGGLLCTVVFYAMTGQPVIAAVAFLGGFYVADRRQKARMAQKREMLEKQYQQVLSTVRASLQGGLNPYQALSEAAPSMPSPSKEVFYEILRRSSVNPGTKIDQIISDVAKETGWKDLDSMAVAFQMYYATGCNLVDVFSDMLKTAYDRQADRKYVRAANAQMMATGTILSVIPFVIIGGMKAIAPQMIKPMFTTLTGLLVFGFVVLMVLIGNQIIKIMVQKTVGNL